MTIPQAKREIVKQERQEVPAMPKDKFPPCPNCGRKGLHYANHAHAQGWKDYSKAECRFCLTRFKIVPEKKDKQNNMKTKK